MSGIEPLEDTIVNIAAYRFVRLDNLEQRRSELRTFCREQGLRGTILLSPEGINLFLAGGSDAIDALLTRFEMDPSTTGIEVKRSYTDRSPFRRLLVKIKKHIIPFGRTIDAADNAVPRVDPLTLKSWLDRDEPIVLLDVRNDYEVRLGTFQNAHAIGISHFRHFPEAAEQLPAELRASRIVTFCTGGIRCEKAAPYMQHLGFADVWQLDGGILKYFEQCGNAHYQGECFVFDHRVAVNTALAESATVQCFACQTPLLPADQQSPLYLPGIACPYCHQTDEERHQRLLARRNRAIAEVCRILPGSQPYTNRRVIWVAHEYHDWTAIEFLLSRYPYAGREAWMDRLRGGWVQRADQPLAADDRVRRGDCLHHLFANTVEPDVATGIRVLHEDEAIVVVQKPAPLPVHPCGRFNFNTLISILNRVYRPARLRLAHRIDANTTGLVVLSRSMRIARRIQPQFENRTVKKSYLVRVHGHPTAETFECRAPIGTHKIATGARQVHADGQAALTHFRVEQTLPDGTAILHAFPVTGRTNQIRIHAWHLGYPIVGDPTYLPHRQLGRNQTMPPGARPLCLHSHWIQFVHPNRNEPVEFTAEPPAWSRE